MNRELFIDLKPKQVQIALLEDGDLVELHEHSQSQQYAVGDIFFARVARVMPSLGAAFIYTGIRQQEGFLHYTDLGKNFKTFQKLLKDYISGETKSYLLDNLIFEPELDKNGSINNVIKNTEYILVQVLKEPIAKKGARLSCDLSLAGKYMVLMPFSQQISVSRKIASKEEKDRLSDIIRNIRPENFGVIVRTAAEEISEKALRADLDELLNRWKTSLEKAKEATYPTKVYSEADLANTLIRDNLSKEFSKIVSNDNDLCKDIKASLKNIDNQKAKAVEQYKGKEPLFDKYNITHQIKSLFGRKVNMTSGAYLIIEHTEAMHVVDVNSGNRTAGTTQQSTAVTANMEAVYEIARQLRLRDLGGIVVIDFIDMHDEEHREMVYRRMKEAMKPDKARHTILPITRFGLMQITRQRVKPEINVKTAEACPLCNGSGSVRSTLLILDDIEKDIEYLFNRLNFKELNVHMHPFVHAYLTNGIWNQKRQWAWKYKKNIELSVDEMLGITDYRFIDSEGQEIIM